MKLIAILLFCCCSAVAQWVPLTAKIKVTEQLVRSNGTQSQRQINGQFLRWSDGTELSVTTVPGTSYETGTYIDGPKGIAYRISTEAKTLIIDHRFSGPRLPVHSSPPPGRASHTINGVYCVAVPITGRYISSGEGCFSPEYNLLVKQEFDRRDGASIIHKVKELYDISIGQEPDREQLPDVSQFRILEKAR